MADYQSHLTVSDTSGVATQITLPSINGGGGNGILLGIAWRDLGTTVNTPTYGGSTSGWGRVPGLAGKISDSGISVDMWYALNLGGTEDIIVPWTGVGGLLSACAVVFSGMNTLDPFGTVLTAQASGTPANNNTINLTGEIGGGAFDVMCVRNAPENLAVIGTQTLRGPTRSDAGSAEASWSTDIGAISQPMGWTWDDTIAYVHIAIPLKASGAVALPFMTTVGAKRI